MWSKMKALLVCVSSLFLSRVLGELDISVGSNTRHEKKNNKGSYRTKEEVERPPVADHPCNLTRTAVKISFPAMKEAVFVNFLGYREPNLQYVMRCKGVCGIQETSSESSQACVPTRVSPVIIIQQARKLKWLQIFIYRWLTGSLAWERFEKLKILHTLLRPTRLRVF